MVKSLINKIKRGIFVAAAGLFLAGCPNPIHYTEEPTPIVTARPTTSPTAQPTPTNSPIPNVRVYGDLQDNETDTDKAGEVRIYVNNSLYDKDSNGNDFSFSVPYGSNVKLEGKISEGNGSYIRTEDLGNVTGDEDIKLRAVPYPSFCTPENFKKYMDNMNGTFSKWDLSSSGFNKIKIFKKRGDYSFNDNQINIIKEKIKNENDIEKFVDGKNLDDYIEVVDEFTDWGDWQNSIYVLPSKTEDNWTASSYAWATIIFSQINLFPRGIQEGTNNTAITHEFGHAFIAPDSEADGPWASNPALSDSLTIMNAYPNGTIPKAADIKAGKIVYEDTYQPGENLDNILGTSW
jgi:hypothetical protein